MSYYDVESASYLTEDEIRAKKEKKNEIIRNTALMQIIEDIISRLDITYDDVNKKVIITLKDLRHNQVKSDKQRIEISEGDENA
jgi:hypothetical protein